MVVCRFDICEGELSRAQHQCPWCQPGNSSNPGTSKKSIMKAYQPGNSTSKLAVNSPGRTVWSETIHCRISFSNDIRRLDILRLAKCHQSSAMMNHHAPHELFAACKPCRHNQTCVQKTRMTPYRTLNDKTWLDRVTNNRKSSTRKCGN